MQEKQAELDARKLADNIRLEEENCRFVDLQTENERKKSDAKAYDSEVILKTFAGVDKDVIKSACDKRNGQQGADRQSVCGDRK